MKVLTSADQHVLFEPIPVEKYDLLSKEELIILLKGEQNIRLQLQKDNDRLRALSLELKQKQLVFDEQLVTIKNKLFGKSSERLKGKTRTSSLKGKKRVLLPSQRYPNTPLIERHVTLDKLPTCKCCHGEMVDSGMFEESEFLTKIPSQYYVVVQLRHKYSCKTCHGDIVTAPVVPRITPGGVYSDELIIDVAVSKYCDLIPIERQAKMADREGVKNIPPQSFIAGTHQFADFLRSAYLRLEEEMLVSKNWNADETPHRMLEGDKKNKWFLWGFSTNKTAYFQCHDTRSGDVAHDLLSRSKCEFLSSDVFSGYGRAVDLTNAIRKAQGLPPVQHVYCNAHARRKFKEALEVFKDTLEKAKSAEERARAMAEYLRAKRYVNEYSKIYRLEKLAKSHPDQCARIRKRHRKYFEKMRNQCMADVAGYSNKSKFGMAMNYFLKNYEGFTRYMGNPELPIDNNQAERLLRNPVIGRKTWYGTHSKRGAETMAILFSLMESCKLNKVNPREYLKNLVRDLHQGKNPYTPNEYAHLQKNH